MAPRLKEFCVKGHPLSGDNILLNQGKRRCKTCRRAYWRAYYDECKDDILDKKRWMYAARKVPIKATVSAA